jgi:hypothetical protein
MTENPILSSLLEETRDLREEFVTPVYLSLLNANFLRTDELDNLPVLSQIRTFSDKISDEQINKLLRLREWRGRLVAAWLVGLSGRQNFVDEIGKLLLVSEVTYSGQGYCLALGLIGSQQCRDYLINYLTEYLPVHNRVYDQLWAIGALAHVDEGAAKQFLSTDLWVSGKRTLDPSIYLAHFKEITQFLIKYRMVSKLA